MSNQNRFLLSCCSHSLFSALIIYEGNKCPLLKSSPMITREILNTGSMFISVFCLDPSAGGFRCVIAWVCGSAVPARCGCLDDVCFDVLYQEFREAAEQNHLECPACWHKDKRHGRNILIRGRRRWPRPHLEMHCSCFPPDLQSRLGGCQRLQLEGKGFRHSLYSGQADGGFRHSLYSGQADEGSRPWALGLGYSGTMSPIKPLKCPCQ